jgi:uncharacterized repeat protein (TIGR02543 family)
MLRSAILFLLVGICSLGAQEINPQGVPFPAVSNARTVKGGAILPALGNKLPEVAAWYGMTVDEFRSLTQRDHSLMMDRSGRLAYACAGLALPEGAPVDPAEATTPQPITYPLSETFFLHSRPNSNRKIYLDFNGHTTSGTIWNSSFNNGNSFTTPPYDIDGNTANFSNTELNRIQGIWKRVAEDFAAYDVDVTTEDPGVEALRRSSGSDGAYGIRVCIGGSAYDWFRSGAGGVAYVGSFNWNSDTPCFSFTAQLGNGAEKSTAEATSHEVGHTLGLGHDGQTGGTEYYGGHANWAPIMGVGYGRDVVQWSQGEYTNANNKQNDTTVMTNFGAPLRTDTEGSNFNNAFPLTSAFVTVTGAISTRADVDYFRFTTGAGPVSFSTASPTSSPNLDVAMTLYDVQGNIVASSDPGNSLNASVSATVGAGVYYLSIEGTAPGNPVTSYNDYGSLGGYELTGSFQSTAENFVTVIASDATAAETPKSTATNPQTPNPATFTFTRLIVTDQPLTVPFTISGTATHGADYDMPTTVTIPARSATATITVTPEDDLVSEGTETVVVTLNNNAAYTLGNPKTATVQLRDNDLPQVNVLTPVVPQVLENSSEPLALTVRRSFAAQTRVTVRLLVTGSAIPGEDYVALPATAVLEPGAESVELLIQPIDNATFNMTKNVSVAIAADADYVVGFQSQATILILNEEAPPDVSNPTVSITSPKAKQRFESPVTSLVATGTATDNLGVTSVLFRVNGSAWTPATLTPGAWSAELASHVVPGPNLLEVRPEDSDANSSPMASLTFTVVKRRNLDVVVTGGGSALPKSGPFEVSQNYTLTAKPSAGKIFAGWTGGLTGSARSLPFTMPDADLQVTATFVDNPFGPGVAGRYVGLVQGTTLTPDTTGLLDIVVSSTGRASGKLWLAGKALPFRGEFNGSGRADVLIPAPKQPKLLASLTLDVNPNGTQQLTGTITAAAGVCTVTANRAAHDKKQPLSSEYARSYTFYLPQSPLSAPASADPSLPDGTDSAPKPRGFGVGTLSISPVGLVKWVGTLGDGTSATQTTVIDAQKRWSMYVPLHKGRGYIAGRITHDFTALSSDLQGTANWVKAPNPQDLYFPGGFVHRDHAVLGVAYTMPAKDQRALAGFNTSANNAGPLSMIEGNLEGNGLNGTLTLLPNNTTQITSDAEKLKITIAAKTGAFTGSFIHPVSRKNTQIRGVLLQGKIGKGIGSFLGTTLTNNALQSGRLEFLPAVQ